MRGIVNASSAYLAEVKGQYRSPVTYKYKKNFLGRLQRFLSDRDFTEETARAYCANLPDIGWSASSAYREIVELRTFIKFCYRNKYIRENFVENIQKPRINDDPPQILLVDMETAERAIIEGTMVQHWYNKTARRANEDMRVALLLILYTGLRFSEVSVIKGSDLFLDASPAHVLVLLKGRKQNAKQAKQIYLPKGLVELLRPFSNREQLFHISDAGCNRAINRGLKALNIPFKINCHGLRHIVGNEENRQGMSGYYLQKHMNHRKYETTVKYYLQNNLDELAHQVDLYNPLARRALSAQDKMNTLYDQARRWVGNDDALIVERQADTIVVRMKTIAL